MVHVPRRERRHKETNAIESIKLVGFLGTRRNPIVRYNDDL